MSYLERFVAFFLPLATGLYILVTTYFGGDLSLMPGDLGDTRFNLFVLEHCHQFFTGQVNAFWNAGFMYPEAEVISFSDNLLGSAPFYSVFRLLGFGIFSAFQLWAITLAILNYTCAYLLVSYLSKRSWFAGVAAFIFAFSIGLAAQMNHAQTFPRFAIPLCLLFLLLWKDRRHWKWFFMASLGLTYAFYCGIYLGFMASVPFLVIFISIVWKHYSMIFDQLKNWKGITGYGISILVNVLLLYKLFAPYLRRTEGNSLHSFDQIRHSIPTLESYLSAHPGTFVHGSLENFIGQEQTAFWDHWIFAGWIGTLGLISSFVFLLRARLLEEANFDLKNARIVLLAGFITFLFFLRVGDYSLYALLHELPGFGAMRSMTRIINIELLFMGIGAAILFSYVANRLRNYRIFLFLVLIPVLIFDNSISSEQAHTTPKEVMQKRQENLITKMKHIPKGAVVSYEPNLDSLTTHIAHYQLDAMLAAQALGLKSVNGYSAQAAYRFDRYWVEPNEENRKYWFDRFEDLDEKNVYVVH